MEKGAYHRGKAYIPHYWELNATLVLVVVERVLTEKHFNGYQKVDASPHLWSNLLRFEENTRLVFVVDLPTRRRLSIKFAIIRRLPASTIGPVFVAAVNSGDYQIFFVNSAGANVESSTIDRRSRRDGPVPQSPHDLLYC